MTTNVETQVRCPRCGGGTAVEKRCTTGPHHAKLVCSGCGGFLRWLPRPQEPSGEPPPEVLAHARRCTRPLARLEGSEGQRRWAASLRSTMIAAARDRSDPDRLAVLRAVRSAAWFAANGRRAYEDVRWPATGELAEPDDPP